MFWQLKGYAAAFKEVIKFDSPLRLLSVRSVNQLQRFGKERKKKISQKWVFFFVYYLGFIHLFCHQVYL